MTCARCGRLARLDRDEAALLLSSGMARVRLVCADGHSRYAPLAEVLAASAAPETSAPVATAEPVLPPRHGRGPNAYYRDESQRSRPGAQASRHGVRSPNKHARYRQRQIAAGRCPHCGVACAPYYACETRRRYQRDRRRPPGLVAA